LFGTVGIDTVADTCLLSVVEGHGRWERENKVVVLRELCRAIIYTTKISNRVAQSHVRIKCTVCGVN
jgi:hypothetical protein